MGFQKNRRDMRALYEHLQVLNALAYLSPEEREQRDLEQRIREIDGLYERAMVAAAIRAAANDRKDAA